MINNHQVLEMKGQLDLVVLIELNKPIKGKKQILNPIYHCLIETTQSKKNLSQTVKINFKQSIKNSLKFQEEAKKYLKNKPNKIK